MNSETTRESSTPPTTLGQPPGHDAHVSTLESQQAGGVDHIVNEMDKENPWSDGSATPEMRDEAELVEAGGNGRLDQGEY